jgi:hypothetical protein
MQLNQPHHFFRQNYMFKISNKVRVNSHLDELRLAAEHVDEFDAHRLNIHHCVIRAQVKQYLKTPFVQELLSEVDRGSAVSVI